MMQFSERENMVRRTMNTLGETMSEPSTTAAAGIAGWKLLAGAGGAAGLAAIVVMLMTQPRSPREWAVGLITTVVGSVFGGAAVVQYLDLHSWLATMPGTVGLIGLCFACGLPAWAITRWTFTWIMRRDGKAIDEVMQEAADSARNVVRGAER